MSFIKRILNTDVSYDTIKGDVLPVDVANDVNQELVRALNLFGTVGIIEGVRVDNEQVNGDTYASYDPKTLSVLLRSDRDRKQVEEKLKETGDLFSTCSPLHPYRHEIGHALWEYLIRLYPFFEGAMLEIFNEFCARKAPDPIFLSLYAQEKPDEMFAEATAQLMSAASGESDRISKLANMVFTELLRRLS